MENATAFVVGLGPWNWFVLAVVLFVLETIVPGVHFLWFGVAASVAGTVAVTTTIAWQWQVLIFALSSLATVFWLRTIVRGDKLESDEPLLNERGNQYVGRIVVVEEAIQGGRGKVRVGDTLWPVEGPDMVAGTRAKVTGARGTVLVVESGG